MTVLKQIYNVKICNLKFAKNIYLRNSNIFISDVLLKRSLIFRAL